MGLVRASSLVPTRCWSRQREGVQAPLGVHSPCSSTTQTTRGGGGAGWGVDIGWGALRSGKDTLHCGSLVMGLPSSINTCMASPAMPECAVSGVCGGGMLVKRGGAGVCWGDPLHEGPCSVGTHPAHMVCALALRWPWSAVA